MKGQWILLRKIVAERNPTTIAINISHTHAFPDGLTAMKAAGINGSVYSHPVGDHGHGAGPLTGLWDRQEGVPRRGDVRVMPNTWYSIELSVKTPVPEWSGQELFVGAEEDAALVSEGKVSWVLRRQTDYHLVR